jgi:hypothetical protein
MTKSTWLKRYIFRGLGIALLAAIPAVLYLSCSTRTDPARDAKEKEAMKRVFEAQHGGADDAIRKYNEQRKQAKPARKEVGK